MTRPQDEDCLVIGAGFAGLRAATYLRERGLRVRVLEARSRVGGRTEPGMIAGHRIDIGGMWLGPTQSRLAALASRFQVATYPQYLDGRCSVNFMGRRTTAPRDAFESSFALVHQLQMLALIKRIDHLATSVPLDAPWLAKRAEALDRQSVASWCARHTPSRTVGAVVNMVCQALFCAESSEISMLFFLFYVRSAGGFEILVGAQGDGAQSFLFEGGVHQLAQAMADELGDHVELEAPVHAIAQDDEGVTVESERGRFRAQRVIVAVPPPHVGRMRFAPELPYGKRALIARQPMGSCIKVWIAYARPFWRDKGLNGFMISDEHPFSPVFDATPPRAKVGLLAGFLESAEATAASHLSAEARREMVIDTLVSHLGEAARRPIDYAEKNWNEDPWADGCYGAYLAPGVLTTRGDALRAPVGRVHWAGTETAKIWTGYIEGALESGLRAAKEVIRQGLS